nr:serine/arginine-rich splicing factor SR45-like [Aegilops tauschii subsp. strangulata]
MTRTNRLPGGDDKHDYRTRQPHHRASPTPRASANFNRKCPSMDTTDDIRQPPPVPKPRPPLRRSKVVSSRRKTTPERRHHPIRRFGAFTRDEEGRARGGLRSRLQEGEQRRSVADIVAAANSQGVSPNPPPPREEAPSPDLLQGQTGKPQEPATLTANPPPTRPEAALPASASATRRRGADALHRRPPPPRQAQPRGTEHHRAQRALPPGTGPATAARCSAVTPSASATPPPADPDPRRP